MKSLFLELGIAPCMYAGDDDETGIYCPKAAMDPSSLPIDCTSFVYDAGVLFDDQYANDLGLDEDCKLKLLLISNNYKFYCFINRNRILCTNKSCIIF